MKKGVVIALLLALFVPFGAMAVDDIKKDSVNYKQLVVINSYHEDELWSNSLTQAIELYAAKNDSLQCFQHYLNNSAVDDMETYNTICDNIFERYQDNHPEYVVLVGNFAFTLRDRIKEEWGDIPFLLISRIETYAPTEQYFSSFVGSDSVDVNTQIPIGRLRSKYNFTAIIVPDCYEENLNLIMSLQPNIKELVFLSDKAFVNRVAAVKLEATLHELYPHVKFRWFQASTEKRQEFIEMLHTPNPEIGILMSSWAYELANARGHKTLTSRDLVFIPESENPIFTMRSVYSSIGCVGGAFSNSEEVEAEIVKMVEAMIQGEDMQDIPFYMPKQVITRVNYSMMKKYGLDLKKLPKGTEVLGSPEGFFEAYWPVFVLCVILFVIVIFVIAYRNRVQRKQISVLERHTFFVNNLPIPYTKAILWLDENNNVVNNKYETMNAAYEELIKKNSLSENSFHLFSNEYMSELVHKMLANNESISVRHHFKRSDTYCYFIFVPFKRREVLNHKSKNVKKNTTLSTYEVDVFALDVTKDHMLQQQLKDQAVTIDISMEMARLIPWQWDAATNKLSFYAYHNNLLLGDAIQTTKDGKLTSVMSVEEFLQFMPQEDAEKMTKSYAATLRGEVDSLDVEYRLRRKENEDEYDWCECHGMVTDTDSDGKPLRMTGSLQVITDRKKQEEIMADALNKAKESDMLKSAFLANMSHEIRTPLNAIVGFSNLLTTTDDPAERQEFAGIINSNNELLLSLINDILDLAKIESNTITLTYDLCDIHDLVSSISRTISIRVPKGVRLNVAHYADSCIVKADAAHISQVLINLLTNATKFTKRGSITIGYEIFEDENKLYFYVKDTGIGISKENIDKVFNRFVKLNNFVQGSGLGLAICRTLVEKMGGEIGVDSPGEGRGATFWFTIPYDPMELKISDKNRDSMGEVVRNAFKNEHIIGEHADRPAKIEDATAINFKTSTDISNNALASIPDGLTVLSVEDNPSNTWLMDRLIQHKFKIAHAENGRIALDMLEQAKPDLIIMDINMPEMDGYEAVKEMRKRGVEVPIIAVTAYAFASDRVRILSSGFDAFVSKPVSASILYDTIVDVWGKKRIKDKG